MRHLRQLVLAGIAFVLIVVGAIIGQVDTDRCGSAFFPGSAAEGPCASSIDLRQDWAFGFLQTGAVAALLAVAVRPSRRRDA